MESHAEEETQSCAPEINNSVAKPATPPGVATAAVTAAAATTATSRSSTSYRQNTVSTTNLYGVRIVALLIDEKERLCLAQISNTLLKEYSYNEIHNRRVALGITCVQCTPVQLEILRRAGAMPISSRRCGMITKREAERLVKSFLEETSPPKLPENFAFDVTHECGWGGRGSFIPSRYNSSRAKCIKCCYCNMFFSPNKFIFHYHRMPESKYSHPDAANFNSWRRHLKLHSSNSTDDLVHAWEDVKAMFNGGNRKRVLNGACSYSRPPASNHHQHQQPKRPKLDPERVPVPHQSPPNTMAPVQAAQPPYHYPVFPIPNKLYSPMKARPAHPAFPLPFPYDKPPMLTEPAEPITMKPAHSPNSPWGSAPETMYPPYEMIWAKHLGLSSNESNYATSYQHAKVSPKQQLSPYQLSPPMKLSDDVEGNADIARSPEHDPAELAMLSNRHEHFSAFRPVACKARTPSDVDTAHHAMELSPNQRGDNGFGHERVSDEGEDDDCSDCENVDVDTVDEPEQNNNLDHPKGDFETDSMSTRTETECGRDSVPPEAEAEDSRGQQLLDSEQKTAVESTGQVAEQAEADCAEVRDTEQNTDKENDDSGIADDSDEQENNYSNQQQQQQQQQQEDHHHQQQPADQLADLSKDELQKELASQLMTRKRLEEDCKVIKDTFQEQVKREQQYREEMAKQLQIVRETLCHELDQERKARFSLQQKLKEAHDALHNFSCKLLASRECNDCTYKEPPMIPR